MSNHLFSVEFGAVGPLAVVPHVPIDIHQAERSTKHGESSQPSARAPLPPVLDASTTGTFISIPTILFARLVVDQRQTRFIVDKIMLKLSQVVQRDVSAVEKRLKDEIQKELVVLKIGWTVLRSM